MPWAKLSYEITMNIYKDFLTEHLIVKRSENIDLSIKELLIRTEILKHDFTKRQLRIIGFIICLSYMCGKESAVIPKLQDFEIAGISKKKIRAELDTLVEMSIVLWNKEEHLFTINEPRFWTVTNYNVGYNDNRARELFLLNLKDAGIDINPIIEKLNKMKK